MRDNIVNHKGAKPRNAASHTKNQSLKKPHWSKALGRKGLLAVDYGHTVEWLVKVELRTRFRSDRA